MKNLIIPCFSTFYIAEMNMKNIKYIAIDMDKDSSRQFIEEHKSDICDIDADLLDYSYAGFGGYMDISFVGQLADDPIIFCEKRMGQNPTHINQSSDKSKDPNWKVSVNIISPVKKWYDKETDDWHVVTSKARIVCTSTIDKKKLQKLHKGDSISGKGILRTYSQRDPQDPTCGRGYWYIDVDSNSLAINAYKTIKQHAMDTFCKTSQLSSDIMAPNDILSNDSLTTEQKYSALQQNIEHQQKIISQLKNELQSDIDSKIQTPSTSDIEQAFNQGRF